MNLMILVNTLANLMDKTWLKLCHFIYLNLKIRAECCRGMGSSEEKRSNTVKIQEYRTLEVLEVLIH